ncbi:hypothetical protein HMPREF1531_01302 [Propionibacterium sp. oral taxon 192 str. F0372]|uniref:FtsX-like permease family protein n=1 Tax=Propionibacterium sp. oral taxon 192 TaxID=671222 RepID=UPI0003527318|nr:FtsX-like permease family protein [Propionibacterium sp. oral taxon 192]EPH03244.1 hypothetical protein HMPREF1531_01302 [Propionibacterium sp. oral taxon 192 str. F0372]
MSPALVRLVLAGDRESRRRLVGIAAGMMLGVALVLMLVSAYQAFGARSLRSTWVLTIAGDTTPLSPDVVLDSGHVATATTNDFHGDQVIQVLKVAATPDSTVHIPGAPRIPAAGEYIASPALAERIAATPADELGDRYGTSIGTLDPGVVEGPESKVIVVGTSLSEVVATSSTGGAQVRTEFIGYEYASISYRIVAVVGAFAVLIPVLLLIGIVTDLGAAQRAERFATLRLIGATPGGVARLAALETGIVSGIGSLLGVGLYFACIPLAARLRAGTSSFYPSDLVSSPFVIACCVVVTMVSATAVAWWRTRRAGLGPLGVSRERIENPPSALSLIPLAVGLITLGVGPLVGTQDDLVPRFPLLIGGFLLTMTGILLVGPLFTWWVARISATRVRSAAAVMGLGRVMRHPRNSFRTVAGLVIAMFVITVFAVAMTGTAGARKIKQGTGYLPVSIVVARTADDPAQAMQRLTATAGVTTTVTGSFPAQEEGKRVVLSRPDAEAMGMSQLPEGADHVSVSVGWLTSKQADPQPAEAPTTPETLVLVATDGDQHSIERVRTILAPMATMPVFTLPDLTRMDSMALENQFAGMTIVGIIVAGCISAVSMAVSGIAGVLAGRRVYSLLGLIGMPVATLRRMIAQQTLTPFVTVVALSIGSGTFTAWALVSGVSSRHIDWPSPLYLSVFAGCAVMILLSILATAKAGGRVIGTTTRFE